MINAAASHCVEGVCYSENARIAINLFASYAERIAFSVPSLMVLSDNE